MQVADPMRTWGNNRARSARLNGNLVKRERETRNELKDTDVRVRESNYMEVGVFTRKRNSVSGERVLLVLLGERGLVGGGEGKSLRWQKGRS